MQNDNETSRIKTHYLRQITEMAYERLNLVFNKNNIKKHPQTASDMGPIPVYEAGTFSLLDLVRVNRPTELVFPDVNTDFVPAYYKRYRDPANPKRLSNIIVVTADNHCWARFFAAKELVHCSLDDDGISATKNFVDFDNLVNELIDPNSIALATSAQTIVDQYAWLGAVQYLIPDNWVAPLQELRTTLCTTNPEKAADADLYLAQLIRVPVPIIKYRLSFKN